MSRLKFLILIFLIIVAGTIFWLLYTRVWNPSWNPFSLTPQQILERSIEKTWGANSFTIKGNVKYGWFKKTEKGYEYWAIASLSLYDEDGNLVHTREIVNQHNYYKEALPSISFKARLILGPNLSEGKYTLVLYFMDGLSKKSVEVEQPIVVKIKRGEAK